jgi:hypothetical protein
MNRAMICLAVVVSMCLPLWAQFSPVIPPPRELIERPQPNLDRPTNDVKDEEKTDAKDEGEADLPKPGPGLAGKYPGDSGIAKDPAVVLHEDFERTGLDTRRWTNVSNKAAALNLVRQTANVHGGKQALQITATMGKNTGGHLFSRFDKGYDKLHCRFMVKFDKDIQYVDELLALVAALPAGKGPAEVTGEKPAGERHFSLGVVPRPAEKSDEKQYAPPGGWSFSGMSHKMPRADAGEHQRALIDGPFAQAPRGRWQCVELMVVANSPGKADGELAMWLDGKPIVHHKKLDWRTDDKLKLNGLWLRLAVRDRDNARQKINRVWFDDVVVATEYIGPPTDPKAKPVDGDKADAKDKTPPKRRGVGGLTDDMNDAINRRNQELEDMLK